MRTHEDTRKDEEVFEDMFESVFWCSRCVRGSCSRGSRVDITAVQNYRRLIVVEDCRVVENSMVYGV